jgi:hypothetical protein
MMGSLSVRDQPKFSKKSFIFLFLSVLTACVGLLTVSGYVSDCSHGTWIPFDLPTHTGFCICQPGWTGRPDMSDFCAYGPQNSTALYAWEHPCNVSYSWDFTHTNPECGQDTQVAYKCPETIKG